MAAAYVCKGSDAVAVYSDERMAGGLAWHPGADGLLAAKSARLSKQLPRNPDADNG